MLRTLCNHHAYDNIYDINTKTDIKILGHHLHIIIIIYRPMRSNIKGAGMCGISRNCTAVYSITEEPFLIWSLSQFCPFQEMNIIIYVAKPQQH